MTLPVRASGRYRFAEFELDLASYCLSRNGTRIKLQPIPFQALVIFLERPGALVSREEIQRRLWPAGTFVDFEQGLNVAIKKLRDALGDFANQPRYIETVSGFGYRFLPTVEPIGSPNGLARTETAAEHAPIVSSNNSDIYLVYPRSSQKVVGRSVTAVLMSLANWLRTARGLLWTAAAAITLTLLILVSFWLLRSAPIKHFGYAAAAASAARPLI